MGKQTIPGFLIIAHRNVVKDRVDVLDKAGISVDKVLFIPEGIARFYSKALNLKKDSAPLGIIDVALNATNYIVLSKGSLVFARPIPVGIKNIMESPDASAKLIEEFHKSVDAYVNGEGNIAPDSYVLTTNHEAVLNITPALGEALKVRFQSSPFTHFYQGAWWHQKTLRKRFRR